jgi:hypothetical protein
LPYPELVEGDSAGCPAEVAGWSGPECVGFKGTMGSMHPGFVWALLKGLNDFARWTSLLAPLFISAGLLSS